MVSKARLDFPEPDSPVMHTSLFRGSRTVMSFRLCSRAPCTTSSSEGMNTPVYRRGLGRTYVRRAAGRSVPKCRFRPDQAVFGLRGEPLDQLGDLARLRHVVD